MGHTVCLLPGDDLGRFSSLEGILASALIRSCIDEYMLTIIFAAHLWMFLREAG